ncbi:MAG: metallophosphoesterase [Bauldia sp.]|nr:metallophosphoesterase [Bauldia sp.]
MFSRRQFLKATGAAALVMPFGGFRLAMAQAPGAPIFSFGVVADPQYAPVAPAGTRFYANSLWKLTEAVNAFNEEDLQFVVTLGDIIDRHWESYAHILPLYDRLKHPNFFVLGNHDFSVASDYLDSVIRTTGLERSYYDFTGGGHRFIVLDGNEISTFANRAGSENHGLAQARYDALKAAGAPNAQTWNGGISDAQFAWVESTLNAARSAGERVVVMGHYPLFPVNEHNLWDDTRLVELLASYDNFLVYMNGHNHAGNYGEASGKHFVNFRGMVETADTTAYSVVDVYDDRLEIRGFGVEESRRLAV